MDRPSASFADRMPWRAWWRLERLDVAWLVALTVIAGVLRFGSPIFLDVLSHPGSGAPLVAWGIGHTYQYTAPPPPPCGSDIAPCTPYVFDELYFANDAHDDLLGRDYLDPEPPLAKLIIAVGIKLFGFTPFGWRVMSAIFGTALVPLMYLLARQLLSGRFFAVAAGLLTTFDGMTFVQSRIAMIDIFPIVLIAAAYLIFHLHLRADTPARQRATIVATALVLGLALGSKWIALAAYGTIAVLLVGRLLLRRIRYDRVSAATVLLSLAFLPATVYALTFIRYLTISHSLTGLGPVALSFAPFHLNTGRAWLEMVAWHKWAFNYHYTLRAPHPYYSPWYSWLILLRPVAYYYQGQGLGTDQVSGAGLVAEIYNLGNPIIWWASIVAILVTAFNLPNFLRRLEPSRVVKRLDAAALEDRAYAAVFILLAFMAAWLPFSRIPRGLFLYHMFGGLPFMILAVALALSLLRPLTLAGPPLVRGLLTGRVCAYAYLAMVIVFFAYFYPLWTGLPLTYNSWLEHMWSPLWI